MSSTDNYGFVCLDDDDPAAVALAMECLAKQFEEQMLIEMLAANSFTDGPSAVWTSSGGSGLASGASVFSFTLADANDSRFGNTTELLPLQGWWMVGANAGFIASGTITAQSYRTLELEIAAPIGLPAGTQYAYDNVYETNTGNGEYLLCNRLIYQTIDPSTAYPSALTMRIYHNNASSLNTQTGPAPTIWASFVGDTPSIVGS